MNQKKKISRKVISYVLALVMGVILSPALAARSTYTAALLQRPAVMVGNIAAAAQASAAVVLVGNLLAAVAAQSAYTAVLLQRPVVVA